MGNTASKRAWVLQFTDIGREDDFLTFFSEEAALKHAADVVADYAKEELERFDWEGETPEALEEALKAAKAGKHRDALDWWEQYARESEPDRSVTLIETMVGE